MKKILVTGGAGFIGSKLSLKLLDAGHQVTVLDNLSEQVHGKDPESGSPLYRSIAGRINFIKGSVTDYELVRKVMKQQDIVVHFAAETGTGQSMYEVKRYIDVNVGGTANILDILVRERHTVEKVILASSRAIYGEGKYFCSEHGNVFPAEREETDMLKGDFECKCPFCRGTVSVLPTSEDSMIHPSSIYGLTKKDQEDMLKIVCRSINLPFTIFRYQNVYGPGQSLKNPYTGILSIFSSLMKIGKEVNVFEDGVESRDFVFVDDVVSATIAGMFSAIADYKIYNVGSGIPVSVLQVANVLAGSIGVKLKFRISGNFRKGDIRHNFADLKKIKSELNFSPLIQFDSGIAEFTEWAEKQAYDSSRYEDSLDEMKKLGLLK